MSEHLTEVKVCGACGEPHCAGVFYNHNFVDKEQSPSKDIVTRLRALSGGARLLGYTAAEEIERLQRELILKDASIELLQQKILRERQ